MMTLGRVKTHQQQHSFWANNKAVISQKRAQERHSNKTQPAAKGLSAPALTRPTSPPNPQIPISDNWKHLPNQDPKFCFTAMVPRMNIPLAWLYFLVIVGTLSVSVAGEDACYEKDGCPDDYKCPDRPGKIALPTRDHNTIIGCAYIPKRKSDTRLDVFIEHMRLHSVRMAPASHKLSESFMFMARNTYPITPQHSNSLVVLLPEHHDKSTYGRFSEILQTCANSPGYKQIIYLVEGVVNDIPDPFGIPITIKQWDTSPEKQVLSDLLSDSDRAIKAISQYLKSLTVSGKNKALIRKFNSMANRPIEFYELGTISSLAIKIIASLGQEGLIGLDIVALLEKIVNNNKLIVDLVEESLPNRDKELKRHIAETVKLNPDAVIVVQMGYSHLPAAVEAIREMEAPSIITGFSSTMADFYCKKDSSVGKVIKDNFGKICS